MLLALAACAGIALAHPAGSQDGRVEVSRGELEALRAEVTRLSGAVAELDAAGPSLAYDSGWVVVTEGENTWLNHNVGGEVGRYIVLCESRPDLTGPISSAGFGVDNTGSAQYGFDWHSLTDTSIAIYRGADDVGARMVRIRIVTY